MDDIGQDVQSAAVRHAHDQLVNVLLGAGFHQALEHGDQGFAALEREALLAPEFYMQEPLE